MFYCCKFHANDSGAIKLTQETLFTHTTFSGTSSLRQKLANLNAASLH